MIARCAPRSGIAWENAVRYRHLFHREELDELVRDAGFTDAVIGHTSDFGETWDNVFVVVCR